MRSLCLVAVALVVSILPVSAQATTDKVAESEPRSYYAKAGPIGEIFHAYRGDPRLKKVGVVGLGVGALAAYSDAGQHWTFFEIDPLVKKAAEDSRRFTFLRDAKGKIAIELGDARLSLDRSKETFGLLIIDAFSSEAIPIHLITREAVALYRKRLTGDGLVVFHISSDFVDLEPVLARLAADAQWVAYSRSHVPSKAEEKRGVKGSRWVVMASHKEKLAPLLKTDSWKPAQAKAGSKVWTDDFSNVLEVLKEKAGK